MFTAALCTITKSWKLKCRSAEDWIKKMWNTTWPRDEMLPFVTACMDLKKMMLSEIQAFGHFTILPSPLYNLYLNSSILELHFYAA